MRVNSRVESSTWTNRKNKKFEEAYGFFGYIEPGERLSFSARPVHDANHFLSFESVHPLYILGKNEIRNKLFFSFSSARYRVSTNDYLTRTLILTQWKCSSPDLQCISNSSVNALTIVSFLLPGVPVVHDSHEFKSEYRNDFSNKIGIYARRVDARLLFISDFYLQRLFDSVSITK